MKEYMAIYEESEDLINIGAYNKGSNPRIDRAIELSSPTKEYLRQDTNERYSYLESKELLERVIRGS